MNKHTNCNEYATFTSSLNVGKYDFTNVRQKLIKKIVKDNDFYELESDYLGMDSYYLDKKTNNIYRICNLGNGNYPTELSVKNEFILDNDDHIIKINNL